MLKHFESRWTVLGKFTDVNTGAVPKLSISKLLYLLKMAKTHARQLYWN